MKESQKDKMVREDGLDKLAWIFIDLNCLRLKWEQIIFVIPFMFLNKYIPCGSFFSLNKFFFHENPDYDYTPYWG
jgi:hypothetical protein